ncbi:MAG: hypothetical protein CMN00_02005 [Rickettsiales bacterium]|nr:hypothetical protein [Rickettsiales bacterium]|tara:strand:+ start:162 stop:725 length:564 start_codon:yes stop_codon:yes gene_type:complete
MKNKNYLSGNIICALPQLKDLFFSKSVIYITHHNKEGAAGIVLNYKIMSINSLDLFEKLNIKLENTSIDLSLHIGGPMSQTNGFILHSNEYNSDSTVNISESVNLTCSTKIIEDIAKNKGPNKYFISLGYAGWGPGQLEKEIIENSWIKINEKLDLIFDTDVEKKWNKAIKITGIDFSKFSHLSGSA